MADTVLIRALATLVDVAEEYGVEASELVRGWSFRHEDYHKAPPYRRIPWKDAVALALPKPC